MLDGHAQNGELVELPVHGAAHRDKGGQLCDVGVHLVATSLLYLAVVLPCRRAHSVSVCV